MKQIKNGTLMEYFFSLDIYNIGGIYNGNERGSNLLNK